MPNNGFFGYFVVFQSYFDGTLYGRVIEFIAKDEPLVEKDFSNLVFEFGGWDFNDSVTSAISISNSC